MDVWLDSKYDLRPKTIQRYQTDTELYIKPALGTLKLDQLKPPFITALYAQLRKERGLAPSSVKHVHSTLSAALKQAFDHYVIAIPVMSKVKAPPVPRIERRVFDSEE